MPLAGYGILYGTVVSVRAPRSNESHWLLIVQPLDRKHPVYRVAIEIAGARIGIQGQWCDLGKGSRAAQATAKGLLAAFANPGAPGSFLTLQDSAKQQRVAGLDYVRSDVVDLSAFVATSNTAQDPTVAKFSQLVRPGARVVICGTGSPMSLHADSAPSTGFTGVTNVHMNQGTRPWIGNRGHLDENGANQDGALFVLTATRVMGLFLKYANQSLQTDAQGDPVDSGIPSIDRVSRQAEPVLQAFRQARAVETADAAAAQAHLDATDPNSAADGFAFKDPAGSQLNDPFIADDDHAVINNPVSQDYAHGRTRAPEYTKGNQSLVMRLEDVRGHIYADSLAGAISFDFIGDTGATSAATYIGERGVAAQLSKLAAEELPAFCFHVGDVVYFYGESNYYACQFGVPFKDYPAPIFAIPGNHDASVYDEQHGPLAAFIEVFCDDRPSRPGVLGGVARTTMTQPGTYFTLDAPFVSIVGLFSGAAESQRYMSETQIKHFYSEMLRLKQLRSRDGERAVILAVHHLPQFYATHPDAVSKGLDAACKEAGLWPDAVVVGHAHLYQRFVRSVAGRQIPYIVSGNGGYRLSPGQDAKVTGHDGVSDNLVKYVLGFVRARCDGKTLSFRGVDKAGQTIDRISVDLSAGTVKLDS